MPSTSNGNGYNGGRVAGGNTSHFHPKLGATAANSNDLCDVLSSGSKSSGVQSPASNSDKHLRGSSLDSMMNYTTLDSSSIVNSLNTNRKLYENDDEISKNKTNKSFSQYVNPKGPYDEVDEDSAVKPTQDVNPMASKVVHNIPPPFFSLLK